MDQSTPPAYGLWSLVIINSLVFIIFAFSFAKPQSPRDWRSFGAFSAFLVALFTEMYGFPLRVQRLKLNAHSQETEVRHVRKSPRIARLSHRPVRDSERDRSRPSKAGFIETSEQF